MNNTGVKIDDVTEASWERLLDKVNGVFVEENLSIGVVIATCSAILGMAVESGYVTKSELLDFLSRALDTPARKLQ